MGSRNLTEAAPSLRRGGSDSTVARTCDIGVLILAGATLILALAVLIIRFTSNRYPSPVYGEGGRSGVRDD
jgi:hypothetical protein